MPKEPSRVYYIEKAGVKEVYPTRRTLSSAKAAEVRSSYDYRVVSFVTEIDESFVDVRYAVSPRIKEGDDDFMVKAGSRKGWKSVSIDSVGVLVNEIEERTGRRGLRIWLE